MMHQLLSALCLVFVITDAFVPMLTRETAKWSTFPMAADSEVTFGQLDGKTVRIGIIRTRWNEEYVSALVTGVRSSLKECNVTDENIFETTVPGSFELPYAAKLLAMSGTVDAIICAGVLIKGETMHFEYIADAVTKGILNVGIQTNVPCVFGVLTCLNEQQVKARSIDHNHGCDWGKTAVEMAILRSEAMGMGKLSSMGFGAATPLKEPVKIEEKKRVGFF